MTRELVGEFVDFNGVKRKFIIALVTAYVPKIAISNEEFNKLIDTVRNSECVSCSLENFRFDGIYQACNMMFGVAICSPDDTFNMSRGCKIAEGKAVCPRTRLAEMNFSSFGALINFDYNTYMQNLAANIAEYPDYYSKGYAKALAKYLHGK